MFLNSNKNHENKNLSIIFFFFDKFKKQRVWYVMFNHTSLGHIISNFPFYNRVYISELNILVECFFLPSLCCFFFLLFLFLLYSFYKAYQLFSGIFCFIVMSLFTLCATTATHYVYVEWGLFQKSIRSWFESENRIL